MACSGTALLFFFAFITLFINLLYIYSSQISCRQQYVLRPSTTFVAVTKLHASRSQQNRTAEPKRVKARNLLRSKASNAALVT
jgi:hypothetical protein